MTSTPLRPRRPHRWLATVSVLALGLAACSKTENGAGTTGTGTSGTVGSTAAPATTGPGTTARPGTTSSPTTGTVPGSTATTGSTGTTATSVPPDNDGGIDPMTDASLAEKSGTATGSGPAHLRSVRAARHEGYDRVVLEFVEHLPDWTVGYQNKPILSDAAGEPVALAGNFAIVVRAAPASGVDMANPSGDPQGYTEIYTGPKRFTPATPEVKELVQTGDFEAVLHWAIGVEDKVEFRVRTLTGPPRLVIDVGNH